MGRPGLPVGSWGRISTREEAPGKWRARCRVRDWDGQVRYLVRYGPTRTKAENALKQALTERTSVGAGGTIAPETRVHELAAAWVAEVADDEGLSRTTRARYRTVAETLVVPGLGQLRVRELNVPAVSRFIKVVTERHGVGQAKAARTVVSGMAGLAIQHGALAVNPTREVRIRTGAPAKRARALTPEEQIKLIDALRADDEARTADLPDLVEFLAGTGCRIGEACALAPSMIDLEHGVVEVAATLTDYGIERRTKTSAGWRRIAVPASLVDMIRRRLDDPELHTVEVVFPSPLGRVRNRSNTTGDLRRAFDRAGFDWVTSHTFRRTVATRLDEAGLSARQVADHLGHARPSLTMDTYMGRHVATSAAADILGQ